MYVDLRDEIVSYRGIVEMGLKSKLSFNYHMEIWEEGGK